jgi:hypothetical protein
MLRRAKVQWEAALLSVRNIGGPVRSLPISVKRPSIG